VIADTDSLLTLDDRQLRAGLAEVIKYGLIDDRDFFDWLEANIPALLARDPDALAFAIERSCADKARVVAADERESGNRALLNLGHTFGHAIETGMGYGEWLHGEAIATGMLLAAELSERMGWMPAEETGRIRRLLVTSGLPIDPPRELDGKRFMELMAVDKKVIDGKMRLILMKGIGRSVITDEADAAAIIATVEAHR
jgi:3-dehydroquinate synthase